MNYLAFFHRGQRPVRFISTLIGLSVFVCLTGVALSAETAGKTNRIALAPSEAVQLVYAEGQVTMNGEAIDIGTDIPDNAIIKTGKDALAEIAFKSKNIIRIGDDTTVQVTLNGLARKIDLKVGSVTAVLHRLDKLAGGGLELKTPLANGGVRGTSFCTWVDPSGKTYFCSCNGSVAMTDANNANPFEQSGAHHNGVWFNKDATGAIKTKAAGVEFHSDKDLETLAARIGDTMDWTSLEH